MKIKVNNELIHESSKTDDLCADNNLVSKEEWLKDAWIGKINNCKKRFIREWQQKLMADPEVDTIPANEEDFIELVTSRPDYKNRVERDEEGKIDGKHESDNR